MQRAQRKFECSLGIRFHYRLNGELVGSCQRQFSEPQRDTYSRRTDSHNRTSGRSLLLYSQSIEPQYRSGRLFREYRDHANSERLRCPGSIVERRLGVCIRTSHERQLVRYCEFNFANTHRELHHRRPKCAGHSIRRHRSFYDVSEPFLAQLRNLRIAGDQPADNYD